MVEYRGAVTRNIFIIRHRPKIRIDPRMSSSSMIKTGFHQKGEKFEDRKRFNEAKPYEAPNHLHLFVRWRSARGGGTQTL